MNQTNNWEETIKDHKKRGYYLYNEVGDYAVFRNDEGGFCLHRKSDGASWSDQLRAVSGLMNELLTTREEALKEAAGVLPKEEDTTHLDRGDRDWVESWKFGFNKALDLSKQQITRLMEK